MQHSIQLKLSADQQELLKNDPGNIRIILTEVVHLNSDQIGYMLQAYHAQQKASKVAVVPDSIVLTIPGAVNLKVSYVLEEFSACSAIDFEDKEEMPVTVEIDVDEGLFKLTGEYWPSLD